MPGGPELPMGLPTAACFGKIFLSLATRSEWADTFLGTLPYIQFIGSGSLTVILCSSAKNCLNWLLFRCWDDLSMLSVRILATDLPLPLSLLSGLDLLRKKVLVRRMLFANFLFSIYYNWLLISSTSDCTWTPPANILFFRPSLLTLPSTQIYSWSHLESWGWKQSKAARKSRRLKKRGRRQVSRGRRHDVMLWSCHMDLESSMI